jgi:hypothetical protein
MGSAYESLVVEFCSRRPPATPRTATVSGRTDEPQREGRAEQTRRARGFRRVAAGRLDVDAYYNDRERDPLIGVGAYWALALLYAAPALLVAAVSPFWDAPKGAVARGASDALLGFALLYTMGVMSFAFDPSRSGGHTPLIRRYEEFSYEAADLVMAATWTMLVTAVVVLVASALSRRTARVAVAATAFVASACLFAVAFT